MRTFTYLSKTLSLEELYKFSKKIATEYASTSASRARSDFMDKYKITDGCYYYLMEFAVSHSLVSETIVMKMIEKLLVNQKSHDNHGYNTELKYSLLLEERKHYSAFLKKDIQYIAKYFAEHPDESKADIAAKFSFCNTKVLDHVLYRACAECIVTDKVFKGIKAHSLSSAIDPEKTEIFFKDLEQKRAECKAKRKKDSTNF